MHRRIKEHREEIIKGFSKKYKTKNLVYFEQYQNIDEALAREKQLKKWRREKKIILIEKLNPEWKDMSKEFGF